MQPLLLAICVVSVLPAVWAECTPTNGISIADCAQKRAGCDMTFYAKTHTCMYHGVSISKPGCDCVNICSLIIARPNIFLYKYDCPPAWKAAQYLASSSPSNKPSKTSSPTTAFPTSRSPKTSSPTTSAPTTVSPTTVSPTTVSPTTVSPTTVSPTTVSPTTVSPTTVSPTTVSPTTVSPTTSSPTTSSPTTVSPTTLFPTMSPTLAPVPPPGSRLLDEYVQMQPSSPTTQPTSVTFFQTLSLSSRDDAEPRLVHATAAATKPEMSPPTTPALVTSVPTKRLVHKPLPTLKQNTTRARTPTRKQARPPTTHEQLIASVQARMRAISDPQADREPVFSPLVNAQETASGLHLITSCFESSTYSATRIAEIRQTLLLNLLNPAIDRVHCLFEGTDPRISIGLLPVSISDKLISFPMGSQPTYADFMIYANAHLAPGSIVILANADVYFDESIAKATPLPNPKAVFALSRRQSEYCLTTRTQKLVAELDMCKVYIGSHDAFIFAVPVPQQVIELADHTQNNLGAENKIIFAFQRLKGYRVSNPCKDISVIHLHCSNERHYNATKTIANNYFGRALPCRLGESN